MNKYKIVFEKTFANRCVSKSIEQAVYFESELNSNQTDEIAKLGYSRLIQENPQFIANHPDSNPTAWSKPIVKNIIRINDAHE